MRTLIVAVALTAAAALPAAARADVGVSIGIHQPGFSGQIHFGDVGGYGYGGYYGGYGVRPIVVSDPASTDEMVLQIDQILLGRGLLKVRDNIVFMAGQPIGRPGSTNFVKLHRMGEIW